MTFERDDAGRTWTRNGKLWGDMSDREVEIEADHWAAESKFYNRAVMEFGQQIRSLYETNDRMRYYNYIAQRELWNRTHKDVVQNRDIMRLALTALQDFGNPTESLVKDAISELKKVV